MNNARRCRPYLNGRHPLGPGNAQDLQPDGIATDLLFQRENAIYADLLEHTGIIVGRRGAGKTAFINQLRNTGRHRFIVFFKASDFVPEILHAIGDIFGSVPGGGRATLGRACLVCDFRRIITARAARRKANFRRTAAIESRFRPIGSVCWTATVRS